MASAARSPVRIRTASSTGITKILPSPMRPVLALFSIASDDLMHHLVRNDDFELHLRHEVHDVRGAAIDFFLAAGAGRSPSPSVQTVMPWMPTSDRASFTSSSLKGLMIASTFFISLSVRLGGYRPRRSSRPALDREVGERIPADRSATSDLGEYRGPCFVNVSHRSPPARRATLPKFAVVNRWAPAPSERAVSMSRLIGRSVQSARNPSAVVLPSPFPFTRPARCRRLPDSVPSLHGHTELQVQPSP